MEQFQSVHDLYGQVSPENPYVRIDNVLSEHFDVLDDITINNWSKRGIFLWAVSSKDPKNPEKIEHSKQLAFFSKKFGKNLLLYLVDSNYMEKALEVASKEDLTHENGSDPESSDNDSDDSDDTNNKPNETPWHSPSRVRKYRKKLFQ